MARIPKKAKWRLPTEPEFDAYGRRIRLRHPPELKEKLIEQQNGLCHWCKRPFNKVPEGETDVRPAMWHATYEHVVRFIDGGEDAEPNLVAAHRKCNAEREEEHTRLKKLKI